MVLVRALSVLLVELLIAVGVAIVCAGLWALARGGPFDVTLGTALFVVGGVALAFGAVGIGGMSPSRGMAQLGRSVGTAPGLLPEFMRSEPGETNVNPNALFVLTGVVMLVLGFVVRG